MAACAASACPVAAASLPALPDIPDLDAVDAATPDLPGGWYLRGGVGTALATGEKARRSGSDLHVERFERPLSADFGIGYALGDWGRLDATVERRFDATTTVSQGASLASLSPGSWRGELASTLLMANAAIDLITWNGLTPFIGGGVGAAFTDVHRFRFDTGTFKKGSAAGRAQWSTAWALVAGIGYQLSPGLNLEASYRYLSIGNARTGVALCGCGTDPLRLRDLAVSEIRLGLRWTIGGSVPAWN